MSNYKGYLIKVGTYKIPYKFMRAETYMQTLYGQDIDSGRDANGMLIRDALPNFAPKAEFETPPLLTDDDIEELMSNIRANYLNTTEKSCNVEFWIQELNKYVTHKCYIPDINFTIYEANANYIKYNQTRIAFISYGGAV